MKSDNYEKKQGIMRAALGLFCTRGFHGTPVPMIAEAADVATGTIYRYFATKEAIANELYCFWKDAFFQSLVADFPEGAPAVTQFAHFWRVLTTFHRDHPLPFAFLETHFHAPYLDPASLVWEDRIIDFAAQFVAGAQRDGWLKTTVSPVVLVQIVFGIFVMLVKQQALGKLTLTEQDFTEAAGCAWDAVARHDHQVRFNQEGL